MCLHPCCHPIQIRWWFIWEVTIVLFAHTNCTVVTSQMNHHMIWIGWQQGCKHISRIRLLEITTTTALRTSPNKRFNEQNNGCARALQIFVHNFAVLCTTTTWKYQAPCCLRNANNNGHIFAFPFETERCHSTFSLRTLLEPLRRSEQLLASHADVLRLVTRSSPQFVGRNAWQA